MVMKSVTYIAGTAVAAMVAMAATPSHAAVDANGTFGFGITSGDIDLNTHDANGAPVISLATTTKTLPATLAINTIPNDFLGNPNNLSTANGGPLSSGTPVSLSNFTIDILSGSPGFSLTTDGLTFAFVDSTLKSLIASGANSQGSFATQYNGTLSADASNTFNTGTPAILGNPALRTGLARRSTAPTRCRCRRA